MDAARNLTETGDAEGDIIDAAIASLNEHGFARTFADHERLKGLDDRSLVFDAFENQLESDPAPGNRNRSHGIVAYNREADRFTPIANSNGYHQAASYNPDAAGKVRHFAPISGQVLVSRTMQWLVRRHLTVADVMFPDIAKKPIVQIGCHMVQYAPHGNAAAFSSPLGLHRDQERIVSVVLFSASSNLGGAENIISRDGRSVEALFKMSQTFETLIVTRKYLHGVTPCFATDGRNAHRNIIIITIQ